MSESGPEVEALLRCAADGDGRAWGQALMRHEPRLRRIASFRLDPRLNGRIDAADVVQEAYVAASSHREDYFRQAPAPLPLFLWLRGIVSNKLLELHRHHLGTKMRDAARDRRCTALLQPALRKRGTRWWLS